MVDPRHIAAQLLGSIDWQSEVSGFCRCPGESLHTSQNGDKDCRVNVDGAPTVFCFHASCAPAVAAANLRLRQELGASSWEIVLPDGQTLRSGDVLQSTDEILKREVVEVERRARSDAPYHDERTVLETLRVVAERFKPELFGAFHWPMERILADSPLQVSEREPDEQFRTWLKLWPAHSTVWIGDVFSSGKPEHKTHFRPVAEWYQIGPAMGNFTCGSAFKPGSFQRSNESIDGHRFLVIESDTLSKDEVGAVFAYMQRRLRYRLHCIVDTAGKSLHAWFDAPRTRLHEGRLKAALQVFGCDPKVFTYSQPVRVPGAWRDGKLQRLVWLRE
ncbi:MAG: hypothetical protein JWO95_1533 [Verrucomicrobiales bacterium]|nr:hypothetical protein [Verrucomicrobiales bacterium]